MSRIATIVAMIGLIFAIESRNAAALSIDTTDECITYWDDNRPPVIEVFEWTEGKGWCLISIQFDSDGDWFLDSAAHICPTEEDAKKLASMGGGGAKGKFVISRFIKTHRKMKRIYPQSMLYEALGADKSFRLSAMGDLRLLRRPLPVWEEGCLGHPEFA